MSSPSTQADYERTTLKNIRLAFTLLGIPDAPMSFGECFDRIGELDGRILVGSSPASGND